MMRNMVRIVMRRVEEQMNVLQEGISENNLGNIVHLQMNVWQEGAREVVGSRRQLGGAVRQHRHDEQEGRGCRAFRGD